MSDLQQLNIIAYASENNYFRRVIYANNQIEITVQNLTPGRVIGWEQHTQTQVFQVVLGSIIIEIMTATGIKRSEVYAGQMVVVPPRTQHQVSNQNRNDSKFITFYAPADHHPGLIEN